MQRLCKIAVILLALTVINYNYAYARNSLSVELIDRDTGAVATGLTFNDHADADSSAPWVLTDQYLHIEFDSDYKKGYWGLRIITDNMTDIAAGSDQPVPYEDADGNKYYGGMINVTLDSGGNISSVTDESAYRIIMGWQVYNLADAATISSVAAPGVSDTDGDGAYSDSNVSTDWWTGDWAYTTDKSDDLSSGDAVLWQDSGGNWVLNYSAVAYGWSSVIRNLTPHPDNGNRGISDVDLVDEDGDGDVYDDGWDIYVFIAGRFWNTAYTDLDGDGTYDDPVYFQLPAGEYKSTIYIEIFHE